VNVAKHCPICNSDFVPELADQPDFVERFHEWQSGVLIQNVWPEATPMQREQLQTGICSDECWDTMFGS